MNPPRYYSDARWGKARDYAGRKSEAAENEVDHACIRAKRHHVFRRLSQKDTTAATATTTAATGADSLAHGES